jgi:hypothetical protein
MLGHRLHPDPSIPSRKAPRIGAGLGRSHRRVSKILLPQICREGDDEKDGCASADGGEVADLDNPFPPDDIPGRFPNRRFDWSFEIGFEEQRLHRRQSQADRGGDESVLVLNIEQCWVVSIDRRLIAPGISTLDKALD